MLTKDEIYEAIQTYGDARKVVEQMVVALEAMKMLDHSFTSQAQMIAAIQAGQKWLEENK